MVGVRGVGVWIWNTGRVGVQEAAVSRVLAALELWVCDR